MTTNKNVLSFVHGFIAIAGFYALNAMAQGAKVDVCHIPPGNPVNAHTITISENALDAHLEHGDGIGPCDSSPTDDPASRKVDLCHIPPANPANAHTITISENALDAHLEHHDRVGACEPALSGDLEPASETEQTAEPGLTVGSREPEDPPASACACPKPGVWRVTNLDGWMECNVLGIKRALKGADRNDGAIWILNDNCSTIFSEAYEKGHDDVLVERGRECMFFGMVPGEEDGADALFDIAYKLESEEFIIGESYLEMSGGGMSCSGFRPFEIDYLEPLSEKDYAKLEKRMEEKLEIERAELDEHRELINEYLEKTDGGQAFGGRNGHE